MAVATETDFASKYMIAGNTASLMAQITEFYVKIEGPAKLVS